MTEVSEGTRFISGPTRRPRRERAQRERAHRERAQWVRTLVAGRQTRTDVVVAAVLLGVSVVATTLNLFYAAVTFPGLGRGCIAGACTGGYTFDLFALSLVLSVVVGTTFGFHAVLKLLNRRNAWVYALADAVVSVACLAGALALGQATW